MTKQHLLYLRDYFKEYKKISEPGFDFPKVFYTHRADIIKKIEQIVC